MGVAEIFADSADVGTGEGGVVPVQFTNMPIWLPAPWPIPPTSEGKKAKRSPFQPRVLPSWSLEASRMLPTSVQDEEN